MTRFPNRRARYFKFTINNPTKADERALDRLSRRSNLTVGLEIAPTTGTEHIQGCVDIGRTVPAGYLKKILPRAHITRSSKARIKEDREYCKKDGRYKEIQGL